MTVNISCVAGAAQQFFDSNGVPLDSGKIYTYGAGGTTPASTYTSSTGLTLNANPIILESDGRTPAEIWLTTGSTYKFVLKDSLNNLIGTYDNIPGVNDFTSASGLSAYLTTFLTTPPPIGSVTPGTGAFTTLSASGAVTGAGFAGLLASPSAIGSVAPAAVHATTLDATSTVGGAGMTAWLASPPAIGTTVPAGGRFTFAHTAPVAVTFSATAMAVDCSLSNVFTTTFTANVTVAPSISNPKDGQTINWFITQDATGSRLITGFWPASFKWPAGVPGVLTTTASGIDLLVATYRSSASAWYATLTKAFS